MIGEPVDLAALYQQAKAQIAGEPYSDQDREFVLAVVRTSIGKSAVLQSTKGMKGVTGETVCPCCGGGLRFSVAGSNGHVWAHCSSSGCVSFLE